MAKEFFKDLPDTTTPLTASRLNGLLDGEEALGNIVVDSIRSKNIFDKNNVETGKYYNASSISASENWCISQIPIKPNTNYYLSGNNYNNQSAHIVLLDSGKHTIQDLGGYKNVHSIVTTSSSAYIGLSIANYSGDSDLDSIMVEEGTIATTYSPFQELNPNNFKNEEIVVGSIRSKNLFNKNGYNSISGYLASANNTITATGSGVKILYIPCKSNTTYTIQKVASKRFSIGTTRVIPAVGVTFYGGIYGTTTTTQLTIRTESQAKYLIVEYYLSGSSSPDTLTEQQIIDSIQIETGSEATPYFPYQNLDGMETYSTEEIIIGTFLGRTLYSKTFTGTLNFNSSGYDIRSNNISNFKFAPHIYGAYQASDTACNTIPKTDSNYVRAYCKDTQFGLVTPSGNVSALNGLTFWLTVEYTKTTD